MITTITKPLNPSGQMLSIFMGVACAEMPLMCKQCPNPEYTGPLCWANIVTAHQAQRFANIKHFPRLVSMNEWAKPLGCGYVTPSKQTPKQTLVGFQIFYLGIKVWVIIMWSRWASAGQTFFQSQAGLIDSSIPLLQALPGSLWTEMHGRL